MGKKRMKKPRIMRPEFIVYYSNPEGWQWALVASNGKQYARCAHPYKTKRGCLRAIQSLKNLTSHCEVVVG